MVRVRAVEMVDDEVSSAVARLLPQLSRSATTPTLDQLIEIVRSPTTTLFAATDEGANTVGMLTLSVFRLPSGVRAWIDDVVVDDSARGSGAGGALTTAALDAARRAGAATVELTSRPDREAANRLYRRLGFVLRETNVYRFTLD